MNTILHPWHILLLAIASIVNREQAQIIDYLKAENRVLKEQLKKHGQLAPNGYYNEGKKKKFRSTVIKIAPKLSLHLRGQAVDISPKSALDPKMVKALKMHLHHNK